jgi:hypothetical protein
MAVQFCRWDPEQKMIGLRFSNVMDLADYAEFPSFESDPASRRWNLWSYIDARDGAQAAVKALAYDRPGFEAFVIAADDTVMSPPSAELMAQAFPDVGFRAEVPGTAALCSLDKARSGCSDGRRAITRATTSTPRRPTPAPRGPRAPLRRGAAGRG